MGQAKNQMMEHDDNLAAATSYLVEIGTLHECEAHGVVFGGGFLDLEDDFYRQVMGDRKRGDSGPIPWASGMEAREFTDLLKEAYDDHPGDRCEHCAAIFSRDD